MPGPTLMVPLCSHIWIVPRQMAHFKGWGRGHQGRVAYKHCGNSSIARAVWWTQGCSFSRATSTWTPTHAFGSAQTTASDFAQGSAVPALAAMILHVVTNIGCIASPLPIGGPPEPPDPGSPTDTLQWRLSVELLTDKVDRCPPDECFLTAGRVDLQPEPIQLPLVTFDCWVDGRDHGNCTSVAYPDGTTVTLTATPFGSSRFAGWGGACSGAQNSCTVSMNEDKKVVAHFNDGL